MFMDLKITESEGKISIFHGEKAIMNGLVPVMKLESGEVRPSFSVLNASEAGLEAVYTFGEGERLSLQFACEGSIVCVSAAYRSSSEMVGGRCRNLAADNSIVLQIEDVPHEGAMLAAHLFKDWWCGPAFPEAVQAVPDRTQSLLWRTEDGGYGYMLPVCGEAFKTVLRGGECCLEAVISTDTGGYSNFTALSFLVGFGEDPFALAEQSAAVGLRALGFTIGARTSRPYPEIFEYLGWCSWDAFYYDVNAKGIEAKAEEFLSLGIPVRWFIVDAGWSDDRDYYLRSFGAHPDKFPEGLEPIVSKLKERYGLRWVGVWHTLIGYWNGIDVDSRLAERYSDALQKTNCGKVVPASESSRAFRFWNDWHGELRRQGIDFVKVDYQSVLTNMLQHKHAIGHAARQAHQALEASVGIHFKQAMINCMGMATENVWNRPASPISRNSEDFFPGGEQGFADHAVQNAYNSIYHSPFIWTDWDMWWTEHETAVSSGVLRAISGGPVYVSDKVGATRAEQLTPLILPDGKILRCDRPGLPTADCLFQDPRGEKALLKIWNRVGEAGVVAVFHVSEADETRTGSVRPKDVPSLRGDRFAVYEHFGQTCVVLDSAQAVPVTLNKQGVALYTIVPILEGVAPIGLQEKYIASASVQTLGAWSDHSVFQLMDSGSFAFYSEQAPSRMLVNGEQAIWQLSEGLYTVEVAAPGICEIWY